MDIELRPLSSIRRCPHNPRRNAAAVDAVARSIQTYGFRQPIVVDEHGEIVVGDTRFLAAEKLGLTEVPVHVARGLTPAQLRAYRICDNQCASLSDWHPDKLAQELAGLQEAGFDLELIGFSFDELSQYLDVPMSETGTDPDAVPAPPDEAISRPGDLWQLGPHKLLCGDSANAEHVDRLLDGESIHLAHLDPPYGVAVQPRSNNALAAGAPARARRPKRPPGRRAQPTTLKLRAKDRPLVNDGVDDDEFERLLHQWFANLARVLLPGHAFYVWGGYANCGNYPAALRGNGLYFSQAIIWDKLHPVLTRKDFMGAHEWAFYGWKEGAAHRFFGPNNVPDLWSVPKMSPHQTVHLTQKPTELARRAISYSSQPGEHVLDLFAGSGTTLIAAEQTGRRAFVMELDPLYVDVIVQRYEQFTGHKADRKPGLMDTVDEKKGASFHG